MLSSRAEIEGRLCNATSYQRIAEFFTPGCSGEKLARYRRYRDLFDSAFAVPRHEVPYRGSSIPAYLLPATGEVKRAIWQRIAAAGFDVIAFEGPGHGGARRLAGLTFDHDWESVRTRARLIPTLRLVVDQALYNVDSDDPITWSRGSWA